MDSRLRREHPSEVPPRIEKKCSGALKNTSHLGQKDARDKRARGNGEVLRNCSTGIMLQE